MVTDTTAGATPPNPLVGGTLSLRTFCELHGLSPSTLHKLRRRGRGPRVTCVDGRAIITEEAAAEWRAALIEKIETRERQ